MLKLITPAIAFVLFAVVVAAMPQAAHAQVYEPEHERNVILRDVFGPRVARGLSDLPAEQFKGAREYAVELAGKVISREITIAQARDSLFKTLDAMEKGAKPEGMPEIEVAVVGKMPIGDVVTGKLVPGADQLIASSAVSGIAKNTRDEAPASDSAEAPAPGSDAETFASPSLTDAAMPAGEEPKLDQAPAAESEAPVATDAVPAEEERGVSSVDPSLN